ncbi:hypothetical protein NGRA_3336 [Nosema granulosis]|uniref:Uncharacterized protein n=1 Tax=Nosema granulosis TaxID=83296 RepID=A0A9P6GVF9_9MICR|nr:hypothetical protein NGRA_3336 [Nosema granulosis]
MSKVVQPTSKERDGSKNGVSSFFYYVHRVLEIAENLLTIYDSHDEEDVPQREETPIVNKQESYVLPKIKALRIKRRYSCLEVQESKKQKLYEKRIEEDLTSKKKISNVFLPKPITTSELIGRYTQVERGMDSEGCLPIAENVVVETVPMEITKAAEQWIGCSDATVDKKENGSSDPFDFDDFEAIFEETLLEIEVEEEEERILLKAQKEAPVKRHTDEQSEEIKKKRKRTKELSISSANANKQSTREAPEKYSDTKTIVQDINQNIKGKKNSNTKNKNKDNTRENSNPLEDFSSDLFSLPPFTNHNRTKRKLSFLYDDALDCKKSATFYSCAKKMKLINCKLN